MKKTILLLITFVLLITSIFSSDNSVYFKGDYFFSYDTNVFSDPLVRHAGVDWLNWRVDNPYIKRFNHGASLNVDIFFYKEARTGLSLSTNVSVPYESTSFKPEGDFSGDWEYLEYDSLEEQKLRIFTEIGPVFRAKVGIVDINMALRLALGSYDYFDSNVIMGIVAEPSLNIFMGSHCYLSCSLYCNAQLMKFYFSNKDNYYEENYVKLSAGAKVGIGYVLEVETDEKNYSLTSLLMIVLSSVIAKPELWVGIDASGGRNKLSSVNIEQIKTLTNTSYKNIDKFVNTVTPSIDLVFFPSNIVRVGLIGSASFNFITGIDGSSYFSRHQDLITDLNGGLAYYQMFGKTLGLYLEAMAEYSFYRFADTNNKNDKSTINYLRLEEFGIAVNIGAITKFDNAYFKFGFGYSKDFLPTKEGWSLDVTMGGGIIF